MKYILLLILLLSFLIKTVYSQKINDRVFFYIISDHDEDIKKRKSKIYAFPAKLLVDNQSNDTVYIEDFNQYIPNN